jgi:hypothetical protein
MIQYIRVLAVGIGAAALGFAADSVSLVGPVSGVVFDSRSQSLRQVTGAPGSSLLGATLANHLEMAEVAPNGNVAIAVQSGQLFAIAGLNSANPAWVPLASMQSIDSIVWSQDSSAAALYSSVARSVVVVSSIANGGAQQTSLSVDSLVGRVTALAVESGGNAVVAGVEGGLYLIASQGVPTLLAPILRPATIYLLKDTDLVTADGVSLQVLEIQNYHSAATMLPLANLSSGSSRFDRSKGRSNTSQSIALAASSDGKSLFVGEGACRCISVYDFTTGNLLNQISVEIEPNFLKPLSNGRLFQLNSPGDSSTPFWMLSAGDAPSVYFVSGGAQ